jgi:hypothetical protein
MGSGLELRGLCGGRYQAAAGWFFYIRRAASRTDAAL